MRTMMMFVLAASLLGGCLWTKFDDLENETWVDSTGKPDVKSNDYGVAIQRGARSGDGGRLVVLGNDEPTYSELIYNAKGESSRAPAAINLAQDYNIHNVSSLLLADPTSDDISLIMPSDNGTALLTGKQGTLTLYQLFSGAPDAATYMLAPGQTAPLPLVAIGDMVYAAGLPSGTPQPMCKLVDSGAASLVLKVRALGAVRNGGNTDDVLVWDEGGKLYKYPSTVFAGCSPSQAQLGAFDTTFAPEAGSQILTIDATTVLLQGHRGAAGYLRVFNVAGPSPVAVGEAVMVAGLKSAAILEVGGAKFVIAGVPDATVDRKVSGEVQLFKLPSTGVDSVVAAKLHDAQPEANQSFGRSVAALPFGGKQVIAVAADNEIFVYFRANLDDGSVLYGETRVGR